eukprot:8397151-Ditylum_brightwellii.AAC.1
MEYLVLLHFQIHETHPHYTPVTNDMWCLQPKASWDKQTRNGAPVRCSGTNGAVGVGVGDAVGLAVGADVGEAVGVTVGEAVGGAHISPFFPQPPFFPSFALRSLLWLLRWWRR